MFIRAVRTIRFPVTFLGFVLQTFPGPTDKLLLVVETAEPLVPAVPALGAAVAPHPAAPVLARDLPGPAGDGTVHLVTAVLSAAQSIKISSKLEN